MNRICTLALALFAGSFAFGETYTWTGAAGDGQWATPGNWAVGEAAAEAAPGAADTAVFAANTEATVNFGELGLTLGTIDLTAKGLDVVFTASDGVEVTVTTLNLGATLSATTGRTKITLDGVTMTAKNAVALNPGTFLKLDNGANLTATQLNMYMAAQYTPEARTELHGGSTLTTSGQMSVNGTSILLIDDSQVYCKGNFIIERAVNGAAAWGRVCFSGYHPLLKVTGTEFYSDGKGSYSARGADFYFTIPEGGFAEPPIQHTNMSAGYFMRGSQSSQPANSRLQVTFDSPAVQTHEAFSQTLVSVGKAMDSTEKQKKTLLTGVKPEDAPTGEIAMSDDKKSFVYTQHASAGIVTVASAPFKFKDVDYTPVVDLAYGDTHTFTAPEHPEISADVTCTGYVIYDVDPVTLKRTKASEGTGTTCDYTHGTGRREVEWQWEVPEVTVSTTGDDLQAAFDAYPCAKINLAVGDYTRSSKGFVIKNAIWLEGQGSDPSETKVRYSTGSGVYYALVISNSLAKVSNVLVSNNASTTSDSNGGIWLWQGLVDGCVVTNCNGQNSSGTRKAGGGIRMEGGTVRNSTIAKCERTRYTGGGIWMGSSSCLVENCRITGCKDNYNADSKGGGIYAANGRIRNCLITGCSSYGTGLGVYLAGSTVMENCTVANCTNTKNNSGAGIAAAGYAEVRNCISWNCTNTSGESDITAASAAGVEACDSIPQMDAVWNNVSVNPQFGEGFDLTGFTACVDSAKPLVWHKWMTDLAGSARIQGNGPDMGCFERAVSEELECSFDFETVEGGTDTALVHFEATVIGDATGAVYTWTVTDRAGNVLATTNGADCASVDIAITNAAFCSFRLDVVNGAGKTASQSQEEALAVYASRVYVNINGSDTLPYATEASGAHSLIVAQEILVDGGEMLIAPGTYDLEARYYFQSGKSAVVKSMAGPDETIVKMRGDAADFLYDYQRPAFQLSTAGAWLEGITIVGGKRGPYRPTGTFSSGGALRIEHSSAVVTNCVIRDVQGFDRKEWGTGVYLTSGKLLRSKIINCSIDTGSATTGGSGLYQAGGLVEGCEVLDCAFFGVPSAGIDGKQQVVDGAIVSQRGGTLRNSLIRDNSSASEAIVYANGTVENCTIVNNTNTCTRSASSDGNGGPTFPLYRVGLRVGASGKVRNTIASLNRNAVLGETNLVLSAGATIDRSVTSGNVKFKSVTKGDWRILRSSPAVNLGEKLDWMDGATDLMGNPRVKGGAPDAGCYENPFSGFMILIDWKSTQDPSGGGEKPDDSGRASTDPTTDPSQPEGGSGSSSDEPETPPVTPEEPETPGEPETPSEPETHEEPEVPEEGIVIPHRGETVPTLARVEGLSDLEQSLYETTVAEFDAVNPIDESTGKRKYISFGFTTDEHSCKRVAGDDAAKDPVKDYWYYFGGSLTKCDHSIRLLGAVAGKVGLDAVFNGGDFSTGNSLTALTDEEYLAQIAYVKSQFAQYLPTTPFFTVDGNHDRNYAPNATYGTLGHQWNDAQWRTALELFNSDVSQNPDVQLTMHRDLAHPTVGSANPGVYTGNTYHVDCMRLMANGKPNVRFVCVSEYDSTPGNGTLLRMYDGFQFYDPVTQKLIDPAKTPDNTLICIISHGNLGNSLSMAASAYMNAGSRKGASTQQAQLNSNLGQHKGLGFIGSVAGHAHQTLVKPIGDNWKSSCVQVRECYAAHNSTAASGYRFSVFTVDTDRKILYETRVVDGTATNYATEIDWATN